MAVMAPFVGAVLVGAAAFAARLMHGHAPGWVFSALVGVWATGLVVVGARWTQAPGQDPIVDDGFRRFARRGVHLTDRAVALDVGMLFATALAWRLLGIGGLPANLLGDEGAQAAEAVRFTTGQLANPFSASDWYGVPLLYAWLVSWPLRVFGTQPAAWRALTAFAGAAAVPALYLAVRSHFGRAPTSGQRAGSRAGHIAMLAALALCFQHLSLYFSRLGSNQGFDPLFLAVTILCLTRAFKRPQGMGWYAAGVVSGLGFHFYFALRGVALITLAIVAVTAARGQWATSGPSAARFRAGAMPVFWFLFGVALAALPLLAGPSDSAVLMSRTVQVWDMPGSVGGTLAAAVADLISRLAIGLRSVQGMGLRGWYESGAGVLVTNLELLLLVFGAARVLRSPRHGWIYLAYFFGIVGAAAVFTENPVGSQRVTAAAVPAAVLIAVGADQLGRFVWPARRALIGTALVVVVAIGNISHLFLDYLPNRENDITALVATEVVRKLNERPEIRDVFFCGGEKMGWRSDAVLPMLTPNVIAIDLDRSWYGSAPDLLVDGVLITAPTCPELRDRFLAEPTVKATQLVFQANLGTRAALRMLMATGGKGYLREVRADLPGVQYFPDEVEVFTLFEPESGG